MGDITVAVSYASVMIDLDRSQVCTTQLEGVSS